jgi:hypothetical protein
MQIMMDERADFASVENEELVIDGEVLSLYAIEGTSLSLHTCSVLEKR